MSSYGQQQSEQDSIYDGREKKALQYIVGLGERNKAAVVPLPQCEPIHRWAFWNPVSGALEVHDAPPPMRKYTTNSLPDLVEILQDVGSEATRVFVDDSEIVAVLNEKERSRETVAISLARTPQFSALLELGSWKTQAEIISVLRRNLAGCDLTGLLAKVRTIRLQKSSDMSAVANHGSESVSSDVKREATAGGQQFPEAAEFQLSVHDIVNAEPDYTAVVRCAVEIDLERAKIAVIPLAGEVERVTRESCRRMASFLANGLRDKGIKVWCGSSA